ncbi:NUDIX hydrolase [Aureimonas mangrovi]|uniref:NUDIX hydrolase n=1 Tax=Aureimonas mangrovi TaxID=2758041 RepID=UPI00163D75D3|nr:NUDIX hydrolase [Aureimonas mangrovi]
MIEAGPAREALSRPAPRVDAKRVRVRDAASVVIIDDTSEPPRILVGRRADAHVFMAGKLVFPGGRIDRSDLALAPSFSIEGPAEARLMARVGGRFDEKRACALALAAIRETFEETGIMLGRAGVAFVSNAPFWSDFAKCGISPEPEVLIPFARAITPPQRVRRYDTRFFAVPVSSIARQVPFEERPTNEFDLVRWITVDEMLGEDLAPITRQVLGDLSRRLERGDLRDADVPMPFYRRKGAKFQREFV